MCVMCCSAHSIIKQSYASKLRIDLSRGPINADGYVDPLDHLCPRLTLPPLSLVIDLDPHPRSRHTSFGVGWYDSPSPSTPPTPPTSDDDDDPTGCSGCSDKRRKKRELELESEEEERGKPCIFNSIVPVSGPLLKSFSKAVHILRADMLTRSCIL